MCVGGGGGGGSWARCFYMLNSAEQEIPSAQRTNMLKNKILDSLISSSGSSCSLI